MLIGSVLIVHEISFYYTEMMRKLHLICTALLVINLLVFSSTPALAKRSPPTKDMSRFEQIYLSRMINQDQLMVIMAQQCYQSVTREKIRELCQQIMISHSGEKKLLQDTLYNWHSMLYNPTIKSRELAKIFSGKATGAASYDYRWMNMMAALQAQSMQISQRCTEQATRAEMVQICKNVIRDHSAELRRMRDSSS